MEWKETIIVWRDKWGGEWEKKKKTENKSYQKIAFLSHFRSLHEKIRMKWKN